MSLLQARDTCHYGQNKDNIKETNFKLSEQNQIPET